MAALNPTPSGFSYAQAARGQTSATPSQASSSKVTSGTVTPATGPSSDLGVSNNWADDVEASAGEKGRGGRKPLSDPPKMPQLKETQVDRAKSESRLQAASSGVSSPDLVASSATDESSAPNGASSESTWDTRSQTSDLAWATERKDRPAPSPGQINPGKIEQDGAKPTEPPEAPVKPPVLHDAPPPVVNPWAKRAEEAKAKSLATASTPLAPQPAPKPSAPFAPADVAKENRPPRADPRIKNTSNLTAGRENDAASWSEDTKKFATTQAPRGPDLRSSSKSGTRSAADHTRTDTVTGPVGRSNQQRERHSLPNVSAIPPPVKDTISWPTPNTVVEKDRKVPQPEKSDEDINSEVSINGAGKKPVWKPFPVSPAFIYETPPDVKRSRAAYSGEKFSRSTHPPRGRGGFRGSLNGPKGGDRTSPRISGEEDIAASSAPRPNATDREAMPPPPKPTQSLNSGPPTESRNRDAPFTTGLAILGNGEVPNASAGVDGTDTRLSNSTSNTKQNIIAIPAGLADTEASSEVKIPDPIPRSRAGGIETNSVRDGADPAREGAHPIKAAPSDGRSQTRASEGYGKEWPSAPRGGKRGGRGRGGSRDYVNTHPSNTGAYGNGYPDFTGASTFGVPPSPSNLQNPRGGAHGFGHPQQGRGSWTRGGQRAQSIPTDNMYGNRVGAFPQLQPVQTYFPGGFDQYGYPMTAMPFPPVVTHQKTIDMVCTQLDYYFSVDNLLKDVFLRQNMDSQGFVFLDVVAKFNRIKSLTLEKDLIRAACLQSNVIDIRVGDDSKERMRRRDGWTAFLLPKEQRDASVQNDGPQELHLPDFPQLQLLNANSPAFWAAPASAGPVPSYQRRSHEPAYSASNGAPPTFVPFFYYNGSSPNGDETRGRATKSPHREGSTSPTHQLLLAAADEKDSEPDAFPDEHANALTVVVKMNQPRTSHHHSAARTFSNGSIDTRSVFLDVDRPAGEQAQPAKNGDPTVNGEDGGTSMSRLTSPMRPLSPDKDAASAEISLFWVKDKEMPVDHLPQDAQLESYVQLRFKALDQRRHAATGTCPYDLDVLYQFWSHFLIRNFNNRMYGEFKFLAHDDAKGRHSMAGLHNLMQFYAKALSSSNTIRDRVAKDYVELVQTEPAILDGAAFKQLRGAWRNGALNIKNRKKLGEVADQALKDRLEA